MLTYFKSSSLIPLLHNLPNYEETTRYENEFSRTAHLHLSFILLRLLINPSISNTQRFAKWDNFVNALIYTQSILMDENLLPLSSFNIPKTVIKLDDCLIEDDISDNEIYQMLEDPESNILLEEFLKSLS